ncbi:hypothetical protein [Treponema sp.]|uniref:hypothetical protein n=1 Tax=Treponema sp. TaxID=166 RepID=UPI00298DB7DB|nr:hypothetical protein [Treponema sp.]MCQ2240593.1 hypothetical protein [Treponema sp.]
MAQFYFLSVLMNILAGLVLVFGINLVSQKYDGELDSSDSFDDELDDFSEESSSESKVKKTFGELGLDSPSFRMVIGILCVFVAVMKILSVFRNDVPVIGDLLPAVAGLLGGASILLEYYIYSTDTEIGISENVQKVFIDSRKGIGYFCFAVALLHFVFPQVLFL